jgi:hypothetical protein
MDAMDYDRPMQANAARVFSERDPVRRLDAFGKLCMSDVVLTEPERVAEGHAAISAAVTARCPKPPPAFALTAIGPAIGHHGLGRLLWKAGPADEPWAVTGMDIAHFTDGPIQTL